MWAEVNRMSTILPDVPPLAVGDVLTRNEFFRRWEAMPGLKRAELIRGIVYIPSRSGPQQGGLENSVVTWIGAYHAATPGSEAACNATWVMGEDAPQPDTSSTFSRNTAVKSNYARAWCRARSSWRKSA
jgi:hypothetical protein